VFNTTDKPLVFYTDDRSATLAPQEKAKIMRDKTFGFAIASTLQNKKLLKT